MVRVEGMAKAALTEGVPWNWDSFACYLDRLDGNLGVNAAFMVGHCALRRQVMGTDAVGHVATPEQVADMRRLLGQAIEAGGLGFSTTQSFTHSDGDGEPVPSRWATPDELLALCDEVGLHPGTQLEWVTDGCLKGFSDGEIDLMIEMSRRAGRPINWNVLVVDSAEPERYRAQLDVGAEAAAPRRPGGGADHAHAGRHEHELPHLLRAVPAARLAGGAQPARARAHRGAARSRDADPAGEPGQLARGRRVRPTHGLGALPDRRHLQPGQRGAQGAAGGRHRPRARGARLLRPGRHRHRRRPAHRPVARPDRRRSRELAPAGRMRGARPTP